MKNKINIILMILLVGAIGVIIYQNFVVTENNSITEITDSEQLYTCGMHPDIISEEEGTCPICEMKLTPIKQKSKSEDKGEVLYWVAPMDPNEIYDSPGKSKMGMDLVPVYENEASNSGVVNIDGTLQQTMNLKTEIVSRKNLTSVITTNGVVAVNEKNESRINSKISGWIENLNVNFEGQQVKKGELLYEIYSPELVSAQQELISAIDYAQSINESIENPLVTSAMDKLKLFDLTDDEIRQIIESKQIKRTLPFYSPVNGTVLMKSIVEGEKVIAGQTILHLADLSKLWIWLDIYESDLNDIKVGDDAELAFDYFPSETVSTKVAFIYPTVDSKTRTTKIRIDLNNGNGKYKPGMYLKAELEGDSFDDILAVTESAVIRSGKNNFAVIKVDDTHFKPVKVELGRYLQGYYEVVSGLSENQSVVTSAQFLIDSESSLKSALDQFSKQKMPDMNMEKKHEHETIVEENEYGIDHEWIRTGVIDVEALDKNGDGKLWECPMDWNIIADEYDRCPSCEMKLKEYTLDEIKNNLKEFGYQYK